MAEEKKERREGMPTGSVPRTVEPASTLETVEPSAEFASSPEVTPDPAGATDSSEPPEEILPLTT